MKKIIFSLLFLVSCSTPYKIVETYTTDSTGKTLKVVQKFYNDQPVSSTTTEVNFISGPMFLPYRYSYFYVPRVYVPVPARPQRVPTPQRPGYGPLPPTPRPRH